MTIPQVFIGGEWIGGCSETFDAFANGELETRLKAVGIPCDSGSVDAGTLLPQWVQPRNRPAG